jgi:hypothetical protein
MHLETAGVKIGQNHKHVSGSVDDLNNLETSIENTVRTVIKILLKINTKKQ